MHFHRLFQPAICRNLIPSTVFGYFSDAAIPALHLSTELPWLLTSASLTSPCPEKLFPKISFMVTFCPHSPLDSITPLTLSEFSPETQGMGLRNVFVQSPCLGFASVNTLGARVIKKCITDLTLGLESTKEAALDTASGDAENNKARDGNVSISSFSELPKVNRARQSELAGSVCRVFLEALLFWNPNCHHHMEPADL